MGSKPLTISKQLSKQGDSQNKRACSVTPTSLNARALKQKNDASAVRFLSQRGSLQGKPKYQQRFQSVRPHRPAHRRSGKPPSHKHPSEEPSPSKAQPTKISTLVQKANREIVNSFEA